MWTGTIDHNARGRRSLHRVRVRRRGVARCRGATCRTALLGARRAEPDLGVRAVAERLVLRAAAAAQRGLDAAVDRAAGAADDLEAARDDERTILARRDRQRCRRAARAARTRFVAGSPVAAKPSRACAPSQNGLLLDSPHRHSVARSASPWPSIDELAVERERAVLANVHEVDLRRLLLRAAVVTDVRDRAGRTVVRELGDLVGGRRVGVDPLALTFGTNTSGRSSTQCREWMHFFASNRIVACGPATSSSFSVMAFVV